MRRRFKTAPVLPGSRPRLARTRRKRLVRAVAKSARSTAAPLALRRDAASKPPTKRLSNETPDGVISPGASSIGGGQGELNFSTPRQLLCSLIAPLTEEQFFSDYWERRPLLIKRGLETLPPYVSLFTLATLRQLVKERLIVHGRHVNVSRYVNGGKKMYGDPGLALMPKQFEKLWTKEKVTVQFLQPQQFQVSL